MTAWVRNAVMLSATAVWAGVVAHTVIVEHQLPDAVTWGVPGALWVALHSRPASRRRRRRVPPQTPPGTDKP